MKRWLIAFVPIGLIVVVLAYVLGSHVMPQSVLDNLANATQTPASDDLADAIPTADATPDATANGQSAENAATPAQDTAQPTPPPSPPSPPPSSQNATQDHASDRSSASGVDDDPDAQAQAQAEIGDAIRRATLKALDSGEPAHWHKDGLSGDVVVSDARDGPGGACRTVSATMGTEDDQKQSGDHIWCQPADGGDWTPQ